MNQPHLTTSDTNSPVKETFWRFSSRKTPGIAKPINNHHAPHKFEKFNGNIIPTKKKEYDSSSIYNHNQYISKDNITISNSTSATTASSTTSNTSTTTTTTSHLSVTENHLSLSASSINSSSSTSSISSSPNSLNSSNSGIDHLNNNNSNNIDNSSSNNNTPNIIGNKYNNERSRKFAKLLHGSNVDLESLKKLGWCGIPTPYRPMVWKILLGYLPSNGERREEILERKRKEYRDSLPQYYIHEDKRTEPDKKTLKQIQLDVPRTNPNVPLFQQTLIQEILERILYIWGIKHPSSGYVQGINDLATPFISVFLSEYVDDPFTCQVDKIDVNILAKVEADSYWCLTKLLDGIQDHYTFAQPGIQRMLAQLRELLEKINSSLCSHLADQDAQFIEFAFRWMNCLLMREIPFPLVLRMWDTYLCEKEGFGVFHVYVCAAFLVQWSDDLKQRDFPDIMIFLQKPPTQNWEDRDIESLFSTAFYYRSDRKSVV